MNEIDQSADWYPPFKDAFKGLNELRGKNGRVHRGQMVASNHAYYAIQNTCRLALGLEQAKSTIGDPMEPAPPLAHDQIADYALIRGLQAFDRIQGRTDFLRVLVEGEVLQDGFVFESGPRNNEQTQE
jgi:hypothetical protein